MLILSSSFIVSLFDGQQFVLVMYVFLFCHEKRKKKLIRNNFFCMFYSVSNISTILALYSRITKFIQKIHCILMEFEVVLLKLYVIASWNEKRLCYKPETLNLLSTLCRFMFFPLSIITVGHSLRNFLSIRSYLSYFLKNLVRCQQNVCYLDKTRDCFNQKNRTQIRPSRKTGPGFKMKKKVLQCYHVESGSGFS